MQTASSDSYVAVHKRKHAAWESYLKRLLITSLKISTAKERKLKQN